MDISVRWVASLAIALLVARVSVVPLVAADWPVWRGPNRDGVSPETDWKPEGISKTLWQKEIGEGWTAVSVHQGKLFVMGNLSNNDVLYCLDAGTGAEQWTARYPCNPNGGGYKGPRATPVVDGDRVYTLSQEGHASCFDIKTGKRLWQRHLTQEFKAKNIKWQFSAAPLVLGNAVIYNAGASGIALDKRSGKELWASAGTGGYAVPVPFKGGKAVAIFSEKTLEAVDVRTGKKLWSYPWQTVHDVNASDPVFDGNWVFITAGYGHGCAALDLGGAKPKRLWENKNIASHFSSPVLHQGRIYGVDGNAGRGTMVCLDPKTGEPIWRENLGFGSFLIAGNRLIYLNERGEVTVGDIADGSFKKLASASVLANAGKCWTMPVLANGLLYCRGSSGKLVCLDLRK
jgi:outer membrane protein assembly factor BamB